MIQSFGKTDFEKDFDIIIQCFKDKFGDKPVSEHIKTIAWMFFLNEYLMGYAIHGTNLCFNAFIENPDVVRFLGGLNK